MGLYEASAWLKARANENRAKYNGPERQFLFALMEHNKYRYVYQMPITLNGKGYIADFAVYSPKYDKPVIFEIDGGYHLDEAQQKLDKERDAVFRHYGFYIKRIPTDKIKGKKKKYIRQIINETMKAYERYRSRPKSK